VLVLVLIFVLMWAALVAILWAGSLWFQAYIYSEPDSDLYWRAPAAASALALFLGFWGVLAYKSPGSYPPLFDLSTTDRQEFPELQAEIAKGNVRHYYAKKDSRGFMAYFERSRGKPLPRRPLAIIVKEDDEEDRFEPDRDKDGRFVTKGAQPLQYRDARGRVMSEDRLGQLSVPRWGRFFVNLLLYVALLVVWFLCLWLLLRFQWTHALGIAVVFWLVMVIVLLPMLLTKVAAAAQQQA